MLPNIGKGGDGRKVFPSHVSVLWGETYELITVTPSAFPADS